MLFVFACRQLWTISVCLCFMLFITVPVVEVSGAVSVLCSLCCGIWFVSCHLVVMVVCELR